MSNTATASATAAMGVEPDLTPEQEEQISNEPRPGYHGNINLKPIGHAHEFKPWQIKEIIRCKRDPIYFIEKYVHIINLDSGMVKFILHEYQKRVVQHMLGFRKAIVMMPRQQGKTIVAAAGILWYTLFQDAKTVAVLANKGAAAREILSRYQFAYEALPLWMQQGVSTWNKGNIELENGSKVFTAATSSSGIRGKSVNWLYVDEVAIIPNNVADEFFTSTFPVISSGKTTKILLTSTPLGYNHFWKYWNEAEKKINGFEPLRIEYWEHPDRDEEWADQQRQTLGEQKFNQEVGMAFLGSAYTLLNGQTLSRLSSVEPTYRNNGLDVYETPDPYSTYVIVVDTARGVGGDNSAFTVIDVTQVPYKLVAKYKCNTIAPMLYPSLIHRVAQDYNNAHILVETNDIGGQIADILYQELEYENVLSTAKDKNKTFISGGFASKKGVLGVRTTKSVKRQGCFAIKTLIEENKFVLFDADIIAEFSTFIEKQGSYAADEGYHDDLVMTLVLFGWLTTNQYFRELTNVDVRKKVFHDHMKQIEDDLTPFGIIDRGPDNEPFVDDGIMWSTDNASPWSNLYGDRM